MTLNGDLTSNYAGAGIYINTTAVTLGASDIAITTNGSSSDDDITITGTIDSASGQNYDLTLNAGASGDIDLQGAVGGTYLLSYLTIETTGSVTLAAVTTIGADSNGYGISIGYASAPSSVTFN